eukprot:8080537-Pyramimonas_sp.AAC.1
MEASASGPGFSQSRRGDDRARVDGRFSSSQVRFVLNTIISSFCGFHSLPPEGLRWWISFGDPFGIVDFVRRSILKDGFSLFHLLSLFYGCEIYAVHLVCMLVRVCCIARDRNHFGPGLWKGP